MSVSPVLGIPHVAATQTNKVATMNAMIDLLEAATNSKLTVNVSAGDVILSDLQFTRNAVFVTTGAPADRVLQVPLIQRVVLVRNGSGDYALTVGGATGASVSIPAGTATMIEVGTTDCVAYGSGGPGPTGVIGPEGPSGGVWREGAGLPDNAVGLDNDFYLNGTNGDVYERVSGAYTLKCNILGPAGATGAAGAGATWREDSGLPDNAVGVDGDFYLDGSAGNVYQRVTGAYVLRCDITGPAGAAGATGSTGPAGTASRWYVDAGVPAPGLGVNNDCFLNSTTGDVYRLVGGSWGSPVCNIRGPTGAGGSIAGSSDASITSPQVGDRLRWDGAHWVNGREPYVVAAYSNGVQAVASQVLFMHRLSAAATFAANFGATNSGAASYVETTANATGSTVISIEVCASGSDPTVGGNWTQIGTATIGAAGHLATLATASGTAKAQAQGDRVRGVGPASPDATAANFMFSLAGDR